VFHSGTMHKLSLVILLVAAPVVSILAQSPDPEPRHWGVVPIPVLGYTPDFGGIFGLAGIGFYGPDVNVPDALKEGRRTNTAAVNGLATSNGSFVLALSSDTYFVRDRYRMEAGIAASRTPREYFGIGDATRRDDGVGYTSANGELSLAVSRRIGRNLFVGPMLDGGTVDILESDDRAYLALDSWSRLGGGVRLVWDSTGGAFYPDHGTVVDTVVTQYAGFGTYTFDLRVFRSPWREGSRAAEHVVAFQSRYRHSWGDPTWDQLATLGGDGVFRGYLEGRFRDTAAASAQVEYRMPLGRRVGVVAFASIGQVGDNGIDMDWLDPKTAAGLGARVTLNADQKLNLRIDIAFSPEGGSPYISAGEAF